jgi:predicted PurR-regulated permease PerM
MIWTVVGCLLLLWVGLSGIAFLHDTLGLIGAVITFTYLLLFPVALLQGWLGRLMGERSARLLAVLLVLGGALSLIGWLTVDAWPAARQELNALRHDFPAFLLQLERLLTRLGLTPPYFPQNLSVEAYQLQKGTTQVPSAFASPALGLFGGVRLEDARHLLDVLSHSLLGLLHGLLGLVGVFYLLLDGQSLFAGFVALLPKHWQPQAEQLGKTLHSKLSLLLQEQVGMALLAGFFLFGLYSVFGLKYALFLAICFGIGSVLPVVGPWVGLLPGLVVAALGPQPLWIIPLLVCTALFYLAKEFWLTPRHALETHPLVVIAAFLLGFQLLGIWGVFWTFPLACLFQVLVHRPTAAQTAG